MEKEAADKDLQAAMPALQRAVQCVQELDPKDIAEMKVNRNPAEIIRYIIDCVLVFFGNKLVPI